jgi:hypothetical protein
MQIMEALWRSPFAIGTALRAIVFGGVSANTQCETRSRQGRSLPFYLRTIWKTATGAQNVSASVRCNIFGIGDMGLPGFTADAAVFRSSRHYRLNLLSSKPAKGVVVRQQSGGTCMDWDCLFWCQDHSSYPETCYDACQVPCDPNAPPEILPAPA